MASAALTSKGQIMLPKLIRKRLGVGPGDRVAFRERDDGVVVVEAETVDLLALEGAVRPRRRGVSLEAMQTAIRRRASGR